MRTTVTIDDDVYEVAAANAQATGRRIGSVLSDMARTAIRLETHSRTRKKHERFATFSVPKEAGVIPASRIQKALDDEDGVI
jgi:negative regulator of replication initiation